MRRRLLLLALAALVAVPAALAADPMQGQQWYLAAVGADQATPPGPGIPLTIVDSGLDASQPDFAGRPATTYLDAQTVTGTQEFHGTEVASVAAAPANGIGVAGVYPQATLDVWDATPVAGGIQAASAAAGIAAAPCPGVINLSWGALQRDPVVEQAIKGAQRKGCLIVAAAGNLAGQGNPTVYPAADLHVLAVGASDESGGPAAFSPTGTWVDLLAPGTAMEVDTTLEHDSSGNVVDSGTSFSAAVASAAAAWVWTERPELSTAQVFSLLKTTTQDGVLDIPAALAAPTPPNDLREPNDTVAEAAGQTPLKAPLRIAGTLDAVKDPLDFYRFRIPAHRRVRISATGGTIAKLVKRTYVEVSLAPGRATARYVVSVRVG